MTTDNLKKLFRSFRTSQHYLANGNDKRSREILEAGVAQFISESLNISLDTLRETILTIKDDELDKMIDSKKDA